MPRRRAVNASPCIYETRDDEVWSVVQLIVADVAVIAEAVTAVMTGPPKVANVKLADVVEVPAPFAEIAA